jgi:hypothetical protein
MLEGESLNVNASVNASAGGKEIMLLRDGLVSCAHNANLEGNRDKKVEESRGVRVLLLLRNSSSV